MNQPEWPLVIAENYDLLDTFFLGLVAFDMFKPVLFLLDIPGVAIVGIFWWLSPGL
jgi:hypothetical protein